MTPHEETVLDAGLALYGPDDDYPPTATPCDYGPSDNPHDVTHACQRPEWDGHDADETIGAALICRRCRHALIALALDDRTPAGGRWRHNDWQFNALGITPKPRTTIELAIAITEALTIAGDPDAVHYRRALL